MNSKPLQSLVNDYIENAKFHKASECWLIKFESGSTLNIECMWRLLEEGILTSTSEDHGQMFGRKTPFNGEEQYKTE